MEKKQKYLTKEEALQKLQRYCAYQDRCHLEVRSKLLDLQVYGDTLEEIMAELIEGNFLNEERFARSFCRGKFRMKKWGRQKIVRELKQRKISPYCIRKALEEIDESVYLETLRSLIARKEAQLKEPDPFRKRSKIGQFLIRRGFEPELVWELLS